MDLLMPELRSMVIRGLTRGAARNLASTGSAALHAVLEARTGLRFFKLHCALAPSIARLRFSAGATSQAHVRCSHGEWFHPCVAALARSAARRA